MSPRALGELSARVMAVLYHDRQDRVAGWQARRFRQGGGRHGCRASGRGGARRLLAPLLFLFLLLRPRTFTVKRAGYVSHKSGPSML